MGRDPIYLVTGANGFIGRALCGRLRPQGHVRALVRRPCDGEWDSSVTADLADDLPLDEAVEGVGTVFHLAGKVHEMRERPGDAAEYHRVNVEGTRRLFDAAARAGVERFVFVSSVKAIGEGGNGCIGEDAVPAPQTPYGRSKREAEELVLGDGRIPHRCVLRPSLVYGAGVKGNILRMIRAVDRGWFPPLPRVDNARSMVHVDDVVEAALLAAFRPEAKGRVFIVTDGRPYSSRQIYEWICRALGRTVPRWSIPLASLRAAARVGDGVARVLGRPLLFNSAALEKLIGSEHFDSSRIRETLGYQPTRTLEDTIPEMVAELRRAP